jgi:hypothetical protein
MYGRKARRIIQVSMLVLLLFIAVPTVVKAQEGHFCGTVEDLQRPSVPLQCTDTPDFPPATTPVSGTLRALVVFVRFQDDMEDTEQRNWPLNLTAPPAFTQDLLADSPDPGDFGGAFPENTLTRYFFDQSQGNLILYGTVHDEIIVSDLPEDDYRTLGWGYLSQEVLNEIDANVNFADYDDNGDGFVDYIFIVVRRDAFREVDGLTWAGVSDLRGGPDRFGFPDVCLEYDGRMVDWRRSGSILVNHTPGNVDAHTYYIRLMAHEFGHDLWWNAPLFGGYLNLNDANDVPNNETGGVARTGYALMIGALFGTTLSDVEGHKILSPYEREILGWLDCQPLGGGDLPGVTITDLYNTSDCKTIDIPSGRTLYLQNHHQTAFFNQYLSASVDGGAVFELGRLRTEGLLVNLVENNQYSGGQ